MLHSRQQPCPYAKAHICDITGNGIVQAVLGEWNIIAWGGRFIIQSWGVLEGSSTEIVIVEKLINCTPLSTPLKPLLLFWKCIISWQWWVPCVSPLVLSANLFSLRFSSVGNFLFLFFFLPLAFSWMYLHQNIWTGQVSVVKCAVCVCTRVNICVWAHAFEFRGFRFCHLH